jgi:hypothetical protein
MMPEQMIGKPSPMPKMGSIKQAAGKAPAGDRPTMGPVEIIQRSAAKEGANAQQLIAQLGALIQRKVVQLLQLGDTVFLLRPQPNGVVEFHTFTVEDPQKLIARYKAGVNSLKQMGFKKATTYAQSPAFVRIAKSTGLPIRIGQTTGPKGSMYTFEMDL